MKDAGLTEAGLLALYDRVAEAEDAIPRLRRFVLDLAVRGKLVPQDAGDEPASVLLERIDKEKALLVKAGELKAERSEKQSRKDVEKGEIPFGWQMATLKSLCLSVTDGDHLPPPKADHGVPFLVIGDVRSGTINYDTDRKVPRKYFDALDPIRKPKSGDILYTLVGSFGIPVSVQSNEEFCVQRHIGILRPSKATSVAYLVRALASEFVFRQADQCATGIAQRTVPLAGLRAFLIPLPPLAEQHRIVAKVEALMALLDRLEAARAAREETRTRLTAATLSRLTEAEADTPTAARFVLQTLPALTTREDQIKTLRQTILNLAVRGKLVGQDVRDEPADKLLLRIRETKSERVRSGKIPAKSPAIRDPEWNHTSAPKGWVLAALGDISDLVTSGSRGWAAHYSESGPFFIRAQNIRFGSTRFDELAHVNPPSSSEGTRTQVKVGDLLIVITGAGVTNPALLREEIGEAYVSQHVGLVRPTDNSLSEWLLLCLLADEGGRAELVARAYGAGKPGLNLDNLRNLTIPLPPLAEQHRIVAKVEELMSLCDRLETALREAATTRARLLDATLRDALAGAQEAA